jgi:hypothetical protein
MPARHQPKGVLLSCWQLWCQHACSCIAHLDNACNTHTCMVPPSWAAACADTQSGMSTQCHQGQGSACTAAPHGFACTVQYCVSHACTQRRHLQQPPCSCLRTFTPARPQLAQIGVQHFTCMHMHSLHSYPGSSALHAMGCKLAFPSMHSCFSTHACLLQTQPVVIHADMPSCHTCRYAQLLYMWRLGCSACTCGTGLLLVPGPAAIY